MTATNPPTELSPLNRQVLNRIQTDFPLEEDPYGQLAAEFKVERSAILKSIRQLREQGIIRRIGGSFAANQLGYSSTLVAARVEPENLTQVADFASTFDEVTHNYERDDSTNLWFTLIAENRERIQEILRKVQACPGVHALYELPAKKLFKIKVDFSFNGGSS